MRTHQQHAPVPRPTTTARVCGTCLWHTLATRPAHQAAACALPTHTCGMPLAPVPIPRHASAHSPLDSAHAVKHMLMTYTHTHAHTQPTLQGCPVRACIRGKCLHQAGVLVFGAVQVLAALHGQVEEAWGMGCRFGGVGAGSGFQAKLMRCRFSMIRCPTRGPRGL